MATELIASSSSAETGMSVTWRRVVTPKRLTSPASGMTDQAVNAVTPDGKDSVTHYETIEAFPSASLLEIHLETGRTHQIRVHMAAIKHPCVGDPLYGGDPTLAGRLGLERQWLHAVELGFSHPRTGEWVVFTSPYPDDLDRALRLVADASP